MSLKIKHQAKSCVEEIATFKNSGFIAEDSKLEKFFGVEGYDVYNPTAPFVQNGKRIIAGRVERRDNEASRTMFFEEMPDGWHLIEDAPFFELQDPCIAFVDGDIVLAGIKYPIKCIRQWGELNDGFLQEFYKGKDIYSLKHAFNGPELMKDIRICQLNDGRVVVFGRPLNLEQKGDWKATISFGVYASFNEITPEKIDAQPYMEGIFIPEEWGGVNQAIPLENGLLGVIGHKSYLTMENGQHMLHYNSMAFVMNPDTLERSEIKIIATRDIFPPTEAKWKKVEDVLFTSGIELYSNGKVRLFTGISDCAIGSVVIKEPFMDYSE